MQYIYNIHYSSFNDKLFHISVNKMSVWCTDISVMYIAIIHVCIYTMIGYGFTFPLNQWKESLICNGHLKHIPSFTERVIVVSHPIYVAVRVHIVMQ